MVRDVVHSAANDQASLGAVLGKHGLLLPHDPSLDDRPPGPDPPDPSFPCRRPGDVWVPRCPSGGQDAWDFSITSALRLGPAVPDPAVIAWVASESNIVLLFATLMLVSRSRSASHASFTRKTRGRS